MIIFEFNGIIQTTIKDFLLSKFKIHVEGCPAHETISIISRIPFGPGNGPTSTFSFFSSGKDLKEFLYNNFMKVSQYMPVTTWIKNAINKQPTVFSSLPQNTPKLLADSFAVECLNIWFHRYVNIKIDNEKTNWYWIEGD